MSAISVGAHSRPAPPRWETSRQLVAKWWQASARATAGAASRLRHPVMTVSGLACIDAAAFQVNVGTGLLTTGVSILLYEWAED
jgi:hypothetical protein